MALNNELFFAVANHHMLTADTSYAKPFTAGTTLVISPGQTMDMLLLTVAREPFLAGLRHRRRALHQHGQHIRQFNTTSSGPC